jgi:acyl-CoA reductase-like NAD-dependent aldehyde dehydrogenase
MTNDDIMLMAQKAGPLTQGPFTEWCQRFANLIAAHKAEVALAEAYRCGYEAGAAAEREACAKVCDYGIHNATDWDSSAWDQCCENRAAAIRARGENT